MFSEFSSGDEVSAVVAEANRFVGVTFAISRGL